ncbi:hypothetical protein YPPY06_4846, partial [Yersinia pestis PY-06]
MRLATAFLTQ